MSEISVRVVTVVSERQISAAEWYSRIARTCGASLPTLSPEFLWQLERKHASAALDVGGDRGGE